MSGRETCPLASIRPELGTIDAATIYGEGGLLPVPIPHGQKNAVDRDGQNPRLRGTADLADIVTFTSMATREEFDAAALNVVAEVFNRETVSCRCR